MIEAMKQMVEALERYDIDYEDRLPIIRAGYKAIEEAEKQEPVAWRLTPRYEDSDGFFDFTDSEETAQHIEKKGWSVQPLYTHPPKREWVGLTDEEYTELWGMKPDLLNFFRKIEAKLKEKNGYDQPV